MKNHISLILLVFYFNSFGQKKNENYKSELIVKPFENSDGSTISSLYLNCENRLLFSTSNSVNISNPNYNITGGTFKLGKKNGEIFVIPDSSIVTIEVFSNTTSLGLVKIFSRKIPLPKMNIFISKENIYLNENEVIKKEFLKNATLVVIPDEDFKKSCSKDSKYIFKIKSIQLTRDFKVISTNQNISSFSSLAKKGDRLLIELETLQRITSLNTKEEVSRFQKFIVYDIK